MPVMKAGLRLCLNGKVVPSENVNLPLLDPFNIAPADLNNDEPFSGGPGANQATGP